MQAYSADLTKDLPTNIPTNAPAIAHPVRHITDTDMVVGIMVMATNGVANLVETVELLDALIEINDYLICGMPLGMPHIFLALTK